MILHILETRGQFHILFCALRPTFEKLFRGAEGAVCRAPNYNRAISMICALRPNFMKSTLGGKIIITKKFISIKIMALIDFTNEIIFLMSVSGQLLSRAPHPPSKFFYYLVFYSLLLSIFFCSPFPRQTSSKHIKKSIVMIYWK